MQIEVTAAAAWFGAAITFSFLFAFDKAFRALFAPLLIRVANIGIGATRITPGAHPFGFLKVVVEDVEQWTKSGMVGSQRAMSWSLTVIRASIHELALTAKSMAHNYALAFEGVWHGIKHAVPHVVRQTIVRPVQKAAAYSDAKLRARVGALAHAVASLNAKVGHLTHATAGAIAAPFPRIGNIEKTVADWAKTLRKLKGLAKVGTIAALGLAILAKLGVSHVRCSRSKKFGDKLCHSNPHWIEDFFLLTVSFLTATSYVEFVKAAQKGYPLGVEGLQKFVTELKDLPIPKS